ncbi:MAG: hypothetical protein PVH87_18830 [Desulfobacteraceae bacterium]|jgi:hypothetical protein
MKRMVQIAVMMSVAIIIFAAAASGAEITLVGEVNDNYQFYANGQLYEVAETPEGNDLVLNYISAKVEVVGTVEEKEDMKIITVRSFRVVPE